MPFRHCNPLLSLSLFLCKALLAVGLLTACTTSAPPTNSHKNEVAPVHSGNLTNFSGDWEKNYQLSDDFNTKFQLYASDIRRHYVMPQKNESAGFNAGSGINGEAINGLARFTEELTRMPILDIKQDDVGVIVERQDDFTLRCLIKDRLYVRTNNAFGSDMCGWNQNQLVFQMKLADGLEISHQLTLSPDGSQLNVTTTVSSSSVAVPVVISNFYTRYNKHEEQYNCQLTLTHNRVCTQRGAVK